MNQSIIISDEYLWNEDVMAVETSAQCMGIKVCCLVSLATLERLAKRKIDNSKAALDVYQELLFDLEEKLTEAVGEDELSSDGSICI